MEIRVKTLRFAFAMAACAVLAGAPAMAQDAAPQNADAPKAGSDSARGDGAGAAGGGATRGGSDTKANDAGPPGDHGTSQSHAPAGSRGIELSKDGRKGTNTATTGTLGTTPAPHGVTLSHGINLVTPDNGYAGLLRRANRKALIANSEKKPTGPSAGIGTGTTQLTRPGREGALARNAVGLVVPGGSGAGAGGAGQHGVGAIGTGGVVAGGHPMTVPNVVTAPTVHAAGINGTTIGHLASGPGIIGGPAKNVSSINGTTVRPKH
jgi:hypothetical protein